MILTTLIVIGFVSCGGGGGDGSNNLEAVDIMKTDGFWTGKLLQAGGVQCVDLFLGACSGCELGDISVEIGPVLHNGDANIVIDHCFSNSTECTECVYLGFVNNGQITAQTEDTSCMREISFTPLSNTEADIFELSWPPSGDHCVINYSSTLVKVE